MMNDMKKIRTIVIDDEKLARNIVRNYLSDENEFEVITECTNGFDAIKKINVLEPDLIFLDIQMPKLNGFEMLEILDFKPQIIFTTAYDEFAIKAFEVNATDYLLKPFDKKRFSEAIEKVKDKLANEKQTDSNEKIEKLNETISNQYEALERVVVKTNNKIVVIPVNTISLIEAQDDYVLIHCSKGKFLKQKTMKFFEKNLPKNDFLRVHRSYILAIDFINQIELTEKDSHIIILKDNQTVPLSKRGYAKLKEILK